MMGEKHKAEWRVIGKSVQGATHIRDGLPNEDAIDWLPKSGTGLPLILAVSDGHGSAKSFRSRKGAQLAVEAAKVVCSDFLNSQFQEQNLSVVKHWAEENLPREIVRRWREYIADELASKPFTMPELEQLDAKEGISRRRQVVLDPIHAYGATILTALVTESFIIYLQLGDGDILEVTETGKVSRPLPKDERLFANETTSLCSPDAWQDFRVRFQVFSSTPPALILLSTDGYANSFPKKEEDFLKVGSDILDMIRSDGLDKVSDNLEGWLLEASKKGSGDDITVGIICRVDAMGKHGAHFSVERSGSVGSKVASTEASRLTEPSSLESLTERSWIKSPGEEQR
jgi:serine/threonine protein phosphatase PrpC